MATSLPESVTAALIHINEGSVGSLTVVDVAAGSGRFNLSGIPGEVSPALVGEIVDRGHLLARGGETEGGDDQASSGCARRFRSRQEGNGPGL